MNSSDDDQEFVLIDSPLSGPMRRDGITIEVCIYRGADEPTWVLEVVDQAQNSFVWDERFATDQAVMEELLRSIRKDGMKQFNPHYGGQLH